VIILRLKIFFIILLFYLFTTYQLFAFINFGAGYSFSNENNWMLRIGYESDVFVANADYFIDTTWNVNAGFFFKTQMSFYIGPMINILNKFSTSNMKITYGPAFTLSYDQLEAKVGLLSDFSQGFQLTNFSENLYTQIRYYVPDPPGMKMRDKLYVELRYFSSHITILIGLLEP